MLTHEWTIFAQSYAVDRETGFVSVFNMLDELRVPADFPDPPQGQSLALGSAIVIIHMWSRAKEQPGAYTARARLLNPEGMLVGGWDLRIDLTTLLTTRTFAKMAFVPFSIVGNYRVLVEVLENTDWVQVSATSLPIRRVATGAAAPAPGSN